MKQSTTTYTKRVNARRAGVAAGIPSERVAITVHKEGDEVRFGSALMQEQMETWTRRFPDNGTPHTKHVTTNLIIEVDLDGTTAKARSYYTVFQQTPDLPMQPIIAGRYHDEFAVIDDVWTFTKRHYINELFGNLSQHLLQAID